MNKSLKTVQKFFEIFKILSTIATTLLFVGVGICIANGVLFLLMPDDIVLSIQESVKLLDISVFKNSTFTEIGILLLVGAFELLAAAITGVFVVKYFKHELKDGTPFTFKGAKELLTISILIMAVPMGSEIISQIILSIFDISEDIFSGSVPIITGVVLIGLSYVFKYGAEIIESLPKSNDAAKSIEE